MTNAYQNQLSKKNVDARRANQKLQAFSDSFPAGHRRSEVTGICQVQAASAKILTRGFGYTWHHFDILWPNSLPSIFRWTGFLGHWHVWRAATRESDLVIMDVRLRTGAPACLRTWVALRFKHRYVSSGRKRPFCDKIGASSTARSPLQKICRNSTSTAIPLAWSWTSGAIRQPFFRALKQHQINTAIIMIIYQNRTVYIPG